MYPPPASPEPLYRASARAAWIGVAINLSLASVKLFGGIVGHSFALLADAVNSLGDSLTSVATLLALRYAQKPADEEHPYGHSRIESIAAMQIALVILVTALWVGYDAIGRMMVVHRVSPLWTIGIAAGNLVIKEVLFRYTRHVGHATGSRATLASAWDHRSDALGSLAVMVGLSLVRWGGEPWLWADEAAALVVVTIIVISAVQLLRSSTSDLLDGQASPEVIAAIRTSALSVAGVRDVDKLRVRKSGLEYLVDIHIQVDATLPVSEGHRIGHDVKDHLLAAHAAVKDVLVHLEPWENAYSAR